MSFSASEAFLHALAERTFLKLWSLPNAHLAPGKELADLVVAFGDDVVLFSDKACNFLTDRDAATGWERWRREAIDGGVKQLGGALRRLSAADQRIFLDASGKAPLPFPLPPPERRRYRLVAIARPGVDPTASTAGWRPLTCVASAAAPFEVEPQSTGGLPVHVFDGGAIDLLLSQLATVPDFIAYLSARAAALDAPGPTASPSRISSRRPSRTRATGTDFPRTSHPSHPCGPVRGATTRRAAEPSAAHPSTVRAAPWTR